ncbi:MAG: High-affinity zinc uptake system membrane protein ZnuB [Firmicutes bacterium ADurb.Bin193]|nr:MAG: High-affinity zinc uptake system membrane protein ZnuB [Firmicutes bacterium ADurb.Bin193]
MSSLEKTSLSMSFLTATSIDEKRFFALEIFHYDFMIRAFTVGILLAIVMPCIGVVVVLKRLSLIGDALSHSSLAGVAAGLVLGINPVLGAVTICTVAALGIESIRKRMPKYSEISTVVIMSAGIGLAGILSGFVPSSANFNSFLFGSIVAISDFELVLVTAVSLFVLIEFIFLYKELFFIALDEQYALLAGVPVKTVSFIFTVLTAATVSVAARTVGALIVSSMMVVPVVCAMQFAKSYFKTVVYSVVFALLFTISGLFISFYANLKPGGTIVLVGIVSLVTILLGKGVITGEK